MGNCVNNGKNPPPSKTGKDIKAPNQKPFENGPQKAIDSNKLENSKIPEQAQKPNGSINGQQPSKKKDLSNFQFMNEKDKFLYKQPGSLAGQQFRLQGCSESNLYVHDNHDQCFVDNCTNCVIVMGPCSSSAFVRNCTDCKIVVTCQQLRVRDCKNVEFMIYSQTQPVIESSQEIYFFCHQYYYPELLIQMKSAKLSIWNNKWNEIYDFTPNQGAKSEKNYQVFTDVNTTFVSDLFQMQHIIKQIEENRGDKIESLKGINMFDLYFKFLEIQDADLEMIELEFDNQSEYIIPFTMGTIDQTFSHVIYKIMPKNLQQALILIFLKNDTLEEVYHPSAVNLLRAIYNQIIIGTDAQWIQETRNTKLTDKQVTELLSVQGAPPKGFPIQSCKIKKNYIFKQL